MILLFLTLIVHPVRASLSEISPVRQTGHLEISLRLSMDDERWLLGDDHDKPDSAAAEETAVKQLREHYAIDGADYRWVGREEEGGHVWWHFEMIPSDPSVGFGQTRVRITLLRDRRDRYHPDGKYNHRLNLRRGETVTGYDFDLEHPQHTIQF